MNATRGRRIAAVAFVMSAALILAGAFAYALTPAGPVVLGGTRPQTPAVSGGRVVWCDTTYGNPDIFMYDAATRAVTRLTTDRGAQADPDISGDIVVWSDMRSGKAQIRARNLLTGAEWDVSPNVADQVRPSISGTWVVWEDYRNNYSPAIYARDLSPSGTERRVASASSSKKRPRVAGDLVVWEDYAAASNAGDVLCYSLSSGITQEIAASMSSELLPDTDGRYVVWTQGAAEGMDVVALDTVTKARTTLWSGRGEQSFPVVSNGVAYWTDNTPGSRLHADTYAFATKARTRFDDGGTADIAGLEVDGSSAVWLAKRGASWQVVARVPATVAVTRLATSLVPRPIPRLFARRVAAVRPPRVSATAAQPLRVVSASVRNGQLGVSAAAPLTIRFSKALDPSAANLARVYLVEDATGRRVATRATYDKRRATVVLRPRSRLGRAAYTLVVDERLVDASGGQIADASRTTFATIRTLAAPTRPDYVRATVSGTASVTVTWRPATGAALYRVYRSNTPTVVADYTTGATLVATVAGTTATVAARSDEASTSYTYNYIVVADDGAGNLSAQSLNASPDVHGLSSSLVDTCRQCHSIHGASTTPYLGSAGAQDCYRCHGTTGATTVYGTNSQYDMQAGFIDESVVATTGPMRTAGAAGYIHRNAGLVTNGHACDSCHGPHRRPYEVAAAGSFDRLLRTQIAAVVPTSNPSSAYRYNTDAAPVGNQLCFDCHGAASDNAETLMDIAAGAGSWSRAGGDHRTNYTSTAHGNVSKVPTPSPDVPTPGIQCMACHDEHASTVPRLLGQYDAAGNVSRMVYGSTVTTLTGNDKSACYGCHTSATPNYPAATRDANGFPTQGTWPGKTVWDTAYSAAAHTGSFHSIASVVWSGAGKAGGDCKNCHVIHGADYQNTRDILRRDVAGTTTFSSATFAFCFKCHGAAGPSADNIARYFPTSAGGGATQTSSTRFGHKTLSAGTLAAGSALPCYDCHNPHGSASAYGLTVVTRSEGATITVGDGAGELAMSPVASAGSVRNFCFTCHSTSDTYKGWNGTAMRALRTTDTVEGISRVTTSTGQHLRLPSVSGHREADTAGCYDCHGNDYSAADSTNVHNPGSGVSNGGQKCYKCHGTYSPMESTDASRTMSYHHVLGGGAFASNGDTATQPGGTGLYPTSTTDVYCISCHSDHNYFNGSKSGNLRYNIADASGAATRATDYVTSGSYGICVSCHGGAALAKDITNQANQTTDTANAQRVPGPAYDVSAHQYSVPATFSSDTSVFAADCIKCHNDSNGKLFQTGSVFSQFGTHFSPVRSLLASLGASVYPAYASDRLCYRCHSETTDAIGGTAKATAGRDYYGIGNMTLTSYTQRVYQQFRMTSHHPVDAYAANGDPRVACESCHNPHVSSATTKVVDPDNTYNGMAYATAANRLAFCLECHDGTLPAQASNSTTFVPFTVTNATTTANKAANQARAHWTAYGSISSAETTGCPTCHDQHGSNVTNLLGVYDGTGSNKIGAVTLTGNDKSVCYGCHAGASTNWPAAVTGSRTASGYPADGTWPGQTVWDTAYNATNHTGSFHAQTSVVWPGASGAMAVGSCQQCHDVHGTKNAYDELRTENDSGVEDTYHFTQADFGYCFDCHDGTPGSNIKDYFPTTVGGNATQTSTSRYGHKTLSAGNLPAGSALPCYDCHNPHGSASAYGLTLVVQSNGATITIGDAAGELTMAPSRTAADVRDFCFGCHTTSDTAKGWTGGGMQLMLSTDRIEGISRVTTTSGQHLRLPVANGHAEADADSCYKCHLSDYSLPGSNNVHNPTGGVSPGGIKCYTCHSGYQAYMEYTGSSRTSAYHHVMGGGTYASNGDTAPPNGTGAYPTSRTDVYCVSCHADHNYFNGSSPTSPAANLRIDIARTSGSPATNTDFIESGSYAGVSTYGICISCHSIALPKDTANQRSAANAAGADASTSTPVLSGSRFAASAHNYEVTSTFNNSRFRANCVKCHDDNQTADFQQSTPTFSLHWSSTRRILAALGYTGADYGDGLDDSFCYKCHKTDDARYAGNPNSLKDYYGIGDMTANAQDVADSMFTGTIVAIINGATTVRSYDIASNTWGTLSGTPSTAPGNGSQLVFHGGNFAYFPGGGTTVYTFQMMDPFGTADANKTPATPRWGTSGSVYSPAFPTNMGPTTGAALASDGMYLYYLQGNSGVKSFLLDSTMGTANYQTKTWVDASGTGTRGMAEAPANVGDGSALEFAGGDCLYALTGGATTKVYQYRISTDTWNDANAVDLPLATAGSADLCWAGGNSIYAIRGSGTNNFYRGTIDATGAISGWTSVTSPSANFGAGADLTWDGGRYIYAFQGGSTAFWRYDTIADSWSTMAVAPASVGANASLVAWRPAGHAEDNAGLHRSDEETRAAEGWMPSEARHVSCVDCHDPHSAASGTHTVATTDPTTKDLGGANEGAWGVEYAPPTYTAGTATFTNGSLTVSGSGTSWTAANGVYAGGWIQCDADKHYYQIATVNSATQLTLAATYKGTTASGAAYTLRLGYTGGTSATFTKNSKTVTGSGTSWSTTVIPVGSYIRSDQFGGWYRVASVDSATQLTINDEYRGTTFTGAYNVIRVAYAKKASGTATRQYQVCLKCHTGYAWGTGSPPKGQSTGTWGRAWKQTDVAVDFDPVNYAYHPLFQRGRNQPAESANSANWTGAGHKAATYGGGKTNPNVGLDNSFVDGWGTQSLVECTDCHDHPTPSSAPEGPHGSSYRWLLKGLDPDVTITMDLPSAATIYPNRSGGTSGGTPYSATAICANCHRGDVYRVSASQYPATKYGAMARFNHFGVSDGNCVPSLPQDGDSGATYWPNGCMNCHGGDTPGSLHGTSRGMGGTASTSEMGKRFTNGSSWASHTLGDSSGSGTCYTIGTANDVSSCTQHSGGRTFTPVYTYTWE